MKASSSGSLQTCTSDPSTGTCSASDERTTSTDTASASDETPSTDICSASHEPALGRPIKHVKSVSFSSMNSVLRVESHHDLSQIEKDATYYKPQDFGLFVRSELSRRKERGITSMSALCPECVDVEYDDDATDDDSEYGQLSVIDDATERDPSPPADYDMSESESEEEDMEDAYIRAQKSWSDDGLDVCNKPDAMRLDPLRVAEPHCLTPLSQTFVSRWQAIRSIFVMG